MSLETWDRLRETQKLSAKDAERSIGDAAYALAAASKRKRATEVAPPRHHAPRSGE